MQYFKYLFSSTQIKRFPSKPTYRVIKLEIKGQTHNKDSSQERINLGHLLEELHHARLVINLYLIKSCKLDLILAGLHTHYDTFWIL
jgi:hypothetical protein